MCGRIALPSIPRDFADLFDTLDTLDFSSAPKGYNISPTQQLFALRNNSDTSKLELAHLRWELVPAWAKDINIGARMINARSETVTEKPAFRRAFKARRCVILANGFYEWKRTSSGSKQPYYIHHIDKQLMCIAGLWESWQSPTKECIETATILTTRANELLSPLHDRMPVMIKQNSLERWLKPDISGEHTDLLQPWPAKDLQLHPVSPAMNRTDFDQASCISPVETNHEVQRELF